MAQLVLIRYRKGHCCWCVFPQQKLPPKAITVQKKVCSSYIPQKYTFVWRRMLIHRANPSPAIPHRDDRSLNHCCPEAERTKQSKTNKQKHEFWAGLSSGQHVDPSHRPLGPSFVTHHLFEKQRVRREMITDCFCMITCTVIWDGTPHITWKKRLY